MMITKWSENNRRRYFLQLLYVGICYVIKLKLVR